MGLGYAIVNARGFAALASVFGSYGLTFITVLFGALLYESYRHPFTLARSWHAGLIPVFWLLLLQTPRATPLPDHPMQVRLIQAPSEEDDTLFRLSEKPAAAPLDLIVWPEYSYVSDPRQQPKLWEKLQKLPQERKCYFLFGAKDRLDPQDDARYYNTAFLLAPSGKIVGRHVKNHPIHFMRDGIPGKTCRAISTPIGRLGIAICFDLDFPDVARRLTQDGAEALLVPSNNPAEWGAIHRAQHRLMFQMRAVECGRWLATADVAGSTYVVAPTGQIVESIPTGEPGAIDVFVGRQTRQTLYLRGGWRFGQFALLALLLIALWARFISPPQSV